MLLRRLLALLALAAFIAFPAAAAGAGSSSKPSSRAQHAPISAKGAPVDSASMASTNVGAIPDIVVNAVRDHTATVIWMHGLGDTGKGWSRTASREDYKRELPHVKFIFPTAPIRPVTVNGGHPMPAWFDIHEFSERPPPDERGVLATRDRMAAMAEREIEAGIAPDRIVLVGFSHGGATPLHTTLSASRTLGGAIGLSCRLPIMDSLPSAIPDVPGRKDVPILQCHGDDDDIVRYPWGKATHDAIRSWGFTNVSFNTYPGMAHSASEEELRDVLAFLKRVLPPL